MSKPSIFQTCVDALESVTVEERQKTLAALNAFFKGDCPPVISKEPAEPRPQTSRSMLGPQATHIK